MKRATQLRKITQWMVSSPEELNILKIYLPFFIQKEFLNETCSFFCTKFKYFIKKDGLKIYLFSVKKLLPEMTHQILCAIIS